MGMTVLENVEVACLAPRVRHCGTPRTRAQALEQVGLRSAGRTARRRIAYGDLRRLEIARALASDPQLLLLDEPLAGLGSSEIGPLANLIKSLHRSERLTILIIEHKLREFMQLVTQVIAMDFGEVVGIGPAAMIVRHPRVIEAYIGNAAIDRTTQGAENGIGAA